MGKSLITAFLLLITAGTCAGQENPRGKEAKPAHGLGEFSAIQAELNRAADHALAGTMEPMADAGSGNDTVSRPPESLGPGFDQPYRPRTNPNASAAMKRLDPLRPLLLPILQSEGLPPDLTSVVLVESGGNTEALSPKGARGLWQLMPATARRYGLLVGPANDERLDVDKSTRAASRYLRDLYQQFGSWPLALAAYNVGEGALQRALERAGSADFLTLNRLRLLPHETRNYVSAVLSAMPPAGAPSAPRPFATFASGKLIFALPEAQP